MVVAENEIWTTANEKFERLNMFFSFGVFEMSIKKYTEFVFLIGFAKEKLWKPIHVTHNTFMSFFLEFLSKILQSDID